LQTSAAVFVYVVRDGYVFTVGVRYVLGLVVHVIKKHIYLLFRRRVDRTIRVKQTLKLRNRQDVYFMFQKILETFARIQKSRGIDYTARLSQEFVIVIQQTLVQRLQINIGRVLQVLLHLILNLFRFLRRKVRNLNFKSTFLTNFRL